MADLLYPTPYLLFYTRATAYTTVKEASGPPITFKNRHLRLLKGLLCSQCLPRITALLSRVLVIPPFHPCPFYRVVTVEL